METIKAYNKGLICKELQYEENKIFTIDISKYTISICHIGFHASKNFDISETINYYPNIENSEYTLVELEPLDFLDDKIVSDKIYIKNKLSLNECINYDKSGKWLYFAALQKVIDKNIILDKLLQIDKSGKWLYLYAKNIENNNKIINKLLQIDNSGKWLYLYAKNISNQYLYEIYNRLKIIDITGKYLTLLCKNFYDKLNLINCVNDIDFIDKTGENLYFLAKNVPIDSNIIFKKIILKTNTAKSNYLWYHLFLKNINGIKLDDTSNILDKIKNLPVEYIYDFIIYVNVSDDDFGDLIKSLINKDISGLYSLLILFNKKIDDDTLSSLLQQNALKMDKNGNIAYQIALYSSNPDIDLLEDTIIQKDQTGELCLEFAKNIKSANLDKLQIAIINKDQTGELCLEFAIIKNSVDDNLLNAIINKDQTGELCLKLACQVDLTNDQMLQLKIAIQQKSQKFYNEFIQFCGDIENENN